MQVQLATMSGNPEEYQQQLKLRIDAIDPQIIRAWRGQYGGNSDLATVQRTYAAWQQTPDSVRYSAVFTFVHPQQEDQSNAGSCGCEGCFDCCDTTVFCCNQDPCEHLIQGCTNICTAPCVIAADPIERLIAPSTSCCLSAASFTNCNYSPGGLGYSVMFQDRQWDNEDTVKRVTCCGPNPCCSKGWKVKCTNPQFIAEDCGINWLRLLCLPASLLLTVGCKAGAAASCVCCVDAREYRYRFENPTYEWLEDCSTCGRLTPIGRPQFEPGTAKEPRIHRHDVSQKGDDCLKCCAATTCCACCLTCWVCS